VPVENVGLALHQTMVKPGLIAPEVGLAIKIRGADRIKPLLEGVPFKDGIPAPDNPPE
jgi:hypothetical protein